MVDLLWFKGQDGSALAETRRQDEGGNMNNGVRVNQQQAVDMIAKGVDFYASALHGYSVSRGGNTGAGIAYGVALDRFKEDDERIRYVVKSYATPIAWRLEDGTWVVPAAKYSRTTSKHQGVVNRGVGQATANGGMVIRPLR
jgi:hypothetical protein